MPSRRNEPTAPFDPVQSAPLSDALRGLAQMGVVRRLRRGMLIIAEGDVGDTLYIVLSGRLRAYSEDLQGRAITFGEYGAGEYVGEMGLDGGPRSANVVATEPTLCAVGTRHTLERYLALNPSFAFDLLAKVIRRARDATQGFRSIALNDVKGRLKDLLERIAVKQPDGSWLADPAPTHGQMAELLGCVRPMVSRVMKEWERGGHLIVGRKRVRILKALPAKW